MTEKFYYTEWQIAEKNGDFNYAEGCKDEYRRIVMKRLIKSFNQFDERLKQFPLINLN